MKYIKPVIFGFFSLLTVLGAEAGHKYDTWGENYNVQSLLGAVKFDNLKFNITDGETPHEADLSLLPQLGGAWMTTPRGDRFQYGLETSFLIGFQADKLKYLSAGGSGLYIRLSTSLWLIDFSGGAYASLFLDSGKKVRIYAGAGPLMMYADYRTEREYSDDSDDEINHKSAFGIGAYGRTGIEFRIHEKGMVGMGVRGSWANADFSNAGGSSDLAGIAGFVTYAAGF